MAMRSLLKQGERVRLYILLRKHFHPSIHLQRPGGPWFCLSPPVIPAIIQEKYIIAVLDYVQIPAEQRSTGRIAIPSPMCRGFLTAEPGQQNQFFRKEGSIVHRLVALEATPPGLLLFFLPKAAFSIAADDIA